MIEFQRVRWKNFVSYGGAWTEVDFTTNRATLVIGDNGAGKSTMIDALCYSLYGKAFRDVSTTQLINSVNTSHMVVECEFKIGKKVYKVVRGLKPRLFEVWLNGDLINQDANARDYQETLEKQLLKINYKSFKQIVVLGSSNFIPFMQLKTNDRKEVIEDLLDIGIFSIMGALLKDMVFENKDELSKIDADKGVVETRIQMIHQHIEQMEKSRSEDVTKKETMISSVDQEIVELEKSIKNLGDNVKKFEQRINDEEKVGTDVRKGEQILDQLLSKHERHSKELNFFHDKDECPTCQQEIDSEFKGKKVAEEQAQVTELEEGIFKLREVIEDKTSRLEEINVIQKDINNTQHEIIDHQSIINSKGMLINELRKQIDQVQNNDKLITDERQKLELDQILNEELYDKRSEAVLQKSVMEVGNKLLKDSGIKSRIIKQYVPVINKLINKYLAAMDFFVQFELDENFNETIKSRYRDEFSYASFSEGEKMRIDLSLLFAWRAIAKLKNSASTNLLIMDEVFDSSLDTTGTDEFMKIIMEIVSDTNVFIISHKTDQLVDNFTSVIRFEKHKNFSRMIA